MKLLRQNLDVVIFDFGAVILPISFKRTLDAFKKLGMNLDEDFGFLSQSPIFDAWDRGLVSTSQVLDFFRSKLSTRSQVQVTDEVLIDAWNAILGRIPEKRLNFLKDLSTRFPLFLFSNTNSLHIEHLRHHDPLMAQLERLFKKTYYSYEMGLRKPDPESFMKIVSEQKLNIKRTLFVDDHPKNIRSADQLGFQTLHCTGDITEMLE